MQFTLRTLLLLFVVVASALAIGGVWGLAWVVYFACVVVSFRLASASRPARIARNLLLLLFLPMAAAVCVPPCLQSHSSARQAACTNRLKQLGLGLRHYHDQYGCFPPACVADKNGRPLHSWRVLILPFIEQQHLYESFRLNEPWDSPYNSKLAARMPDVFRCPDHGDASPQATDYVAVTGPGTMWNGRRGCKIEEIADGASNTLMLVEMADSEIPWNAPFDLTLEDALSTDPKVAKTIRCYHPSTYHDRRRRSGGAVLFADGRPDFLPGRLPADVLKALATIAGHERVDVANLKTRAVPDLIPPSHTFWSRLIGWSILVVSFVFLVTRPLPEAWTRRAERLPEKSVE